RRHVGVIAPRLLNGNSADEPREVVAAAVGAGMGIGVIRRVVILIGFIEKRRLTSARIAAIIVNWHNDLRYCLTVIIPEAPSDAQRPTAGAAQAAPAGTRSRAAAAANP